jgi:hypothetical protein
MHDKGEGDLVEDKACALAVDSYSIEINDREDNVLIARRVVSDREKLLVSAFSVKVILTGLKF